MKHIRGALRTLGILSVAFGGLGLEALIFGRFQRTRGILPYYVLKAVTRLIGARVVFNKASAAVEKDKARLMVANHMSELDPLIFAGQFRSRVVAAGYLRTYPVIGSLIAAAGTIFVRRHKAFNSHNGAKILRALNEGANVMMFPEAVTSDGSVIYEFKAGLLAALFNKESVDKNGVAVKLERDVAVQPVALRILDINGRDAMADPKLREIYTWYVNYQGQEMPWNHKLKQFWDTVCNPGMTLEMTVLPALNPRDFANERDLANEAWRQIAAIAAPHQKAPVKREKIIATPGEHPDPPV